MYRRRGNMVLMNVCFTFVVFLLLVSWRYEVNGQLVIEEQRLVSGNADGSSGRVEVRVNGIWGTVCDDQWDDLDASVLCRSLGFIDGGTATIQASFGQGTGTIWLNNIACAGDELGLVQCPQNPQIGNHNCLHTEDAGVVCISRIGGQPPPTTTTRRPIGPQPDNCASQNTQVRLIAPSGLTGVGLVEIFYNNSWGSICDDLWGETAAQVVCAMLCYDTTFARPGILDEIRKVTNPRVPIIVDNVRCTGRETRVQDCPHDPWYTNDCGAQEIASVTCVNLNSKAPDPPVPDLECSKGFINALFNRSRDIFLETKHLNLRNPGINCTTVKRTDNDTVAISIPFNSCGTTVDKNTTHLIYSNTITYDHTAFDGNKVRVNTYLVSVFCEMPRNLKADRNLEPLTLSVTKKAEGEFLINMTFYRDNSFTNAVPTYPVRMPLGEWLNVALQLESIDARLKLVVPDCVATASTDRSDPTRYPLFENNCPNEPTLGFFPLSQMKFGYRYQPFMFLNNPQVFIHCGAFVCLVDEATAECDRSCNTTKPIATGRRKRDLSLTSTTTRPKYYIDSGPMYVFKPPGVKTSIERIDISNTVSTTVTIPLSEEIQEALSRSSAAESTTQPIPKPTTYGAGVTVMKGGNSKVIATTHLLKEIEDISTTTQANRPEEPSHPPTTPFVKPNLDATTETPSDVTPEGVWIVFPEREAGSQNSKTVEKLSASTNNFRLRAGVNDAISLQQTFTTFLSVTILFFFMCCL